MAEEQSETGTVFDALHLNPQLFINEILNSTDDILDGAFQFALQQASEIVKDSANSGVGRSDELARGVSSIRYLTQAVLDRRMEMWEKYCLRHCFSVPEGFVLPKAVCSSRKSVFNLQASGDGLPLDEEPTNSELDNQLEVLRNKLIAVEKKSRELHKESQSLEKQSTVSRSYNSSVTRTLQLFEQNSSHKMLQEMGETAARLHSKIESMENKRKEDMDHVRVGKMEDANKKQRVMNELIFSSMRVEGIQEIASILNSL